VIASSNLARRPRNSRALLLRAAFCVFLAGGILGLGYATYVIVDANTYQAIEESRLPSVRPVQGVRAVALGDVIGELQIPRIGLKAIFVQGDSPRILRRAVGHISQTALPGESGNVVLTGHRDSFFRSLRNIQPGDAIALKTPYGDFQYQVESTAVVPPSDVQVLEPSSEPTLTLVTCFPFYYVGPAPSRFIVRARLIASPPAQSSVAEAAPRF
jgi:sortase A